MAVVMSQRYLVVVVVVEVEEMVQRYPVAWGRVPVQHRCLGVNLRLPRLTQEVGEAAVRERELCWF